MTAKPLLVYLETPARAPLLQSCGLILHQKPYPAIIQWAVLIAAKAQIARGKENCV
jgi:hypothetical protein